MWIWLGNIWKNIFGILGFQIVIIYFRKPRFFLSKNRSHIIISWIFPAANNKSVEYWASSTSQVTRVVADLMVFWLMIWKLTVKLNRAIECQLFGIHDGFNIAHKLKCSC